MKPIHVGARAQRRIAAVLWPFVLYGAWSCAQGSEAGAIGGTGPGGSSTTSGTGTASTGSTSTGSTSTTGVGASPGVGGSSTTTGFGGSTTTGFGGSTTTGLGGSGVASVASSSSSSSTGGADAGDGFGPCVTQADIDSQSSGPLETGFCMGHPFKCLACSSDAVNPGDIVCSPNCQCVPLPPLCSDGGVDGSVDDAATDDAGTGGAGAGGAGTGGAGIADAATE